MSTSWTNIKAISISIYEKTGYDDGNSFEYWTAFEFTINIQRTNAYSLFYVIKKTVPASPTALHLRALSYGVREVGSSIPDRGNIVGWVFHPTRWLARITLIWKCLSFQILNIFITLSSWWRGNYRPSAPLLYEVANHVKQLPLRPLL